VTEACRVLAREGFLWTSPTVVSAQALSLRLRTLPAALFEGVLREMLPLLHQRAALRRGPLGAPSGAPLEAPLERALRHYEAVVALDGSTLDALHRKVGLLRPEAQPGPAQPGPAQPGPAPLGGRMAALIDVVSRQPLSLWYEADSHAHDHRFWAQARAALTPGQLVLFDLGFVDYALFGELSDEGISFVTRLKKNARYESVQVLRQSAQCRESVIRLGRGKEACPCPLRLVELSYEGQWYQYLTNVLEPSRLSGPDVGALYRQRWRIEDAFKVVKRLLGLAYLAGSSTNAVAVQVWMTWVLYGVVQDLAGEVAERLGLPLSRISVEMVYRGLYHFTQARYRGDQRDVVTYLVEEASGLGVVKRKRRVDRARGLIGPDDA
jgi:hypothetical protein